MSIHDLIARKAAAKTGVAPVTLPPALTDPRPARAGIVAPRVSFIVTSFNYAPYIIDCLRSVAGQSYADWECIVVDDASTDESVALVRGFVDGTEARGRFRLIERPENGGQMEALRTGLAASDGSFVVMLDADDVLLEDFLEAHLRAHLAVTVAFTSSNQYQINGRGEIVGGQHMDHQSKGYYRHVRQTAFQKGFWVWATSSSMVFRRSTLELVMPADTASFRICADYYIAHFCNLIGDSLLVPTIHGCYRRHGANNFGNNPVLGNINSVGDLRKHPPHDLFRQAMIDHILANYDRFVAIFQPKGLVGLLLRLVKSGELADLVAAHPEVFPGPLRRYSWLAARQWWRWRSLPVAEKFRIVPGPARGSAPGPRRGA